MRWTLSKLGSFPCIEVKVDYIVLGSYISITVIIVTQSQTKQNKTMLSDPTLTVFMSV